MKPLPANKALENYFFEARCKLLDIAAILDRVNRGQGVIVAPGIRRCRVSAR